MAVDTSDNQSGTTTEKSTDITEPTIGRIPVRNIWLLMLYASDLFREILPQRRASIEENPDDIPDLVAEILTHAVERRLRRNLSFGFQSRDADLSRVRGRINLLRTERRHLLQIGKVACSFEELTIDTPQNRFVMEALRQLAKVIRGRPALALRCKKDAAILLQAGVSADPSFAHPMGRRNIPVGRRNWIDATDRQMLVAAHLAFDLALPTEDPGETDIASPERNSTWARNLFEKAIGGFYDVVLSTLGWKVNRGRHMQWQVIYETPGLRRILPSMQTDIVLELPAQFDTETGRRIVIDTKFTSIVKRGWRRDETLSSQYIYQIYAYLMSQERDDDALSNSATGMLLHPSVGEDVNEAAIIQGHEVRFVTVDLAASSRVIRDRLLHIINISPLEHSSTN